MKKKFDLISLCKIIKYLYMFILICTIIGFLGTFVCNILLLPLEDSVIINKILNKLDISLISAFGSLLILCITCLIVSISLYYTIKLVNKFIIDNYFSKSLIKMIRNAFILNLVLTVVNLTVISITNGVCDSDLNFSLSSFLISHSLFYLIISYVLDYRFSLNGECNEK